MVLQSQFSMIHLKQSRGRQINRHGHAEIAIRAAFSDEKGFGRFESEAKLSTAPGAVPHTKGPLSM